VARSFQDVVSELTGPGGGFELVDAEVAGRTMKVFATTPPSLRALFDILRLRGAEDDFLVYEDEHWTNGQVLAAVDGLAATLVERYGVQKGDRVGIAMRNFPEWYATYAAVVSIGAVAVAYNAWWTTEELEYGIDDSGTTVLIADAERVERVVPLLEGRDLAVIAVRTDDEHVGVDAWEDVVATEGATMPPAEIDPDDDAMILYTSGTTGHPKGVVSTHRAVLTALMGFATRSIAAAMTRSDEEVAAAAERPEHPTCFMMPVPLFHVTGLVPVMLGCTLGGYRLVMMRKWDPERALELIEREHVTTFVGVPTMSWDLLESPDFATRDTSSLTSVGGGGSAAPPELVRRIEAGFSSGRPNIGYGMTETNAYGPQNMGDDYVRKPTSTGRAVPVMQIEVHDAEGNPLPNGELGEICFRGANLFRGYWNKPEATAEVLSEDGWLRTGDLGRMDDEGFVFIEDRVKDIIIRGGENIGTAEVEAAIYEHPDVYEAAVFGVPHERLGEEVVAAVLLREGSTLTEAELQAHVAKHLASFKVPTRVLFRDTQLPRGATGKILKRDLREEFAAG
jgi:long-chain acyl-CoA synthetase